MRGTGRRLAGTPGAALAAVLVWALVAATPVRADKRADDVVTASLAALGASDAVDSVRSVTAFAQCSGPGGDYVTGLEMLGADRMRFVQQHPGQEAFIAIVRGDSAWGWTGGQSETLDKLVRSMVRGHAFQMIALHPGAWFADMTYDGTEGFNSEICHKVAATDDLGHAAVVYFSIRTGRITGYTIEDPFESGQRVVVMFRRWERTGGVLFPAEVVAVDTDGNFVLNFERITINDVDPSIFDARTPSEN